MAAGKNWRVFAVIIFCLIFDGGQGCRPDWDNKCDQDHECCSKYCRRDKPDWEYGVCDPNDNRPKTSSRASTATSVSTTPRTTSTTTRAKPILEGTCSWYGGESGGEGKEKPDTMFTSCGDIFHNNTFAAAQLRGIPLKHKFPCGTRVRVFNGPVGSTKWSVDVTVNDQSDVDPGTDTDTQRLLALTPKAFRRLADPEKLKSTKCNLLVLD